MPGGRCEFGGLELRGGGHIAILMCLGERETRGRVGSNQLRAHVMERGKGRRRKLGGQDMTKESMVSSSQCTSWKWLWRRQTSLGSLFALGGWCWRGGRDEFRERRVPLPLVAVVGGQLGGDSAKGYLQAMLRSPPWISRWLKWGIVPGADHYPNCVIRLAFTNDGHQSGRGEN